jgi:hypothetical protein
LAEWGLLAQTWFLLLGIDLGLRLLSYQRLQACLTRCQPQPSTPTQTDWQIIRRLAQIVDRLAAHHLYPMTCLRRALALQWLLTRRGHLTDLRLGVRKIQEKLEAHAWLEYYGQPIGEPGAISDQFALLSKQGKTS